MAILDSDARAGRIADLGFDYRSVPKVDVNRCNLCGESVFVRLTHRDRYGFPSQASGCWHCGLVFLDPVMTRDAYAAFYTHTYRPLVSAFHGRLIDATTIQDEQRQYAVERGDLLAPYLEGRRYRSLLDIGGSTGVVADILGRRFDLRATVIDPAPLETIQAQALGIDTIEGLVEDVDLGSTQFDVVVMCQTVDHLLDIGGTLTRIRQLLSSDGVLFLDIVDFRAAYLRQWSVEAAVKIDHPYYLTEATMRAYLGRAGFDVIRSDYAADHLHVSYVARPSPPLETLPSPHVVEHLWREIRFVQNAPAPRL